MEIGLQFWAPASATAPEISRFAAEVEQLGFASMWAGDHAVSFERYESRYPYSHDGGWYYPTDVPFLEPFSVLSVLAAATSRVRLGTGMLLLPQRSPVYVAKSAATLDRLSGGRLDLGIGLGWAAEEYAALDQPFERRGARCRAYVEVMRTLWVDEISAYSGPMYELPPCHQYPKPLQRPHPPLYFGGESDAALRRVADLGTGWYGFNLDVAAAANCIAHLRDLLAQRERDPDDARIVVGPGSHPVDATNASAYAELGVDQLVVMPLGETLDEILPGLSRLRDIVAAT